MQLQLRARNGNVTAVMQGALLRHHMITRRPLIWEPAPDALRSPSAYFTFNPSLIRARDVPVVFSCGDELGAQRRFLTAKLASAQFSPGVFRHIGEHRSLRGRVP